MLLPPPRGPMGTALNALLLTAAPTHPGAALPPGLAPALDPSEAPDPEDAALSLWVLHELHYRGFADVDEAWEWVPMLMTVRQRLEQDLERRLRERFAAGWGPVDPADDVTDLVGRIIEADDAPSLARHLQRRGTREQALALLRQRSLYHLKEADPTSWVIPRLTAAPKAALVEVQSDEYGSGDPERLHHRLFERGMAGAGLEPTYGHYVAEATVTILEQNNAVSMFGLQRRLRGAAVGHFAAFEATSSVPSRWLAQGLRRLEVGDAMADYYDEHVEADAVHEHLALVGVCGALVDEEPGLLTDVAFGAWACLDLEARTATDILERWDAA